MPGGSNSDLVVLIAAISGLLTAIALFGGFVLAVLTFIRQGKRDMAVAEIGRSVDGLLSASTKSARGQADAEIETARLQGEKSGIASERAEPMSPAGT